MKKAFFTLSMLAMILSVTHVQSQDLEAKNSIKVSDYAVMSMGQ